MKHTNLKTLLGGAALTLLFALPAQAAAENFDDAFAQSIAKKAASKSAAAKLATRIQPGQQRYGGEESRGIRGEVPVQEYGQAAANPFEEEHKSEQQPSAAAAAVDFDSAFAQSIAAKKVAKTTAAKLAARIQPGQQKYGGASESASAATALEDFAPSSADEPQASAAASAAEEAVPDFDTAFTKALANRDTAKQKMTELRASLAHKPETHQGYSGAGESYSFDVSPSVPQQSRHDERAELKPLSAKQHSEIARRQEAARRQDEAARLEDLQRLRAEEAELKRVHAEQKKQASLEQARVRAAEEAARQQQQNQQQHPQIPNAPAPAAPNAAAPGGGANPPAAPGGNGGANPAATPTVIPIGADEF